MGMSAGWLLAAVVLVGQGRSGRAIVGEVVDARSRPIAGAEVFENRGGPATTTNDAGRFRLTGARPGRSFLLARRDDFVLRVR